MLLGQELVRESALRDSRQLDFLRPVFSWTHRLPDSVLRSFDAPSGYPGRRRSCHRVVALIFAPRTRLLSTVHLSSLEGRGCFRFCLWLQSRVWFRIRDGGMCDMGVLGSCFGGVLLLVRPAERIPTDPFVGGYQILCLLPQVRSDFTAVLSLIIGRFLKNSSEIPWSP
jgi:hypothetical protein